MNDDFFSDYQNLVSEIDNMTKSKEGYGYKYVELTPLLEEVMPKIFKNNFILIQTVKKIDGEYIRITEEPAIYENKYDKSRQVDGVLKKEIRTPAFVLHGELIHKTGKAIECDLPLYVDDTDPQAFGSAETYARRYSIYALLHIKTEDDDGAAASSRAKAKAAPLETFADFVRAIYKATSDRQLGALWYQWKEKFAKDSSEYKDLNKFSGNLKLRLLGENVTDVYSGCSEKVKAVIEGKTNENDR